jgi:Domain of unknown function (DUF4398)
VLGTFAALVVSCASTAIPAQKLTDSKASLRAAEAVGAEIDPQAALHLKMARDEIREAELLIKEDENERAELVLERAEADAQLAMALAQERQMKAEAETAKRKVEELKEKASE